jgi:hypothetical protein
MKLAIRKNDGDCVLRENCWKAVHASRITHHASAFTLAEVLAALLFLAIVIPTAVEALHVSSLAGEVAARKAAAARVADRVLNESLVTTNWTGGMQSGTITEGILDFRWKLTSQTWSANPVATAQTMELLTAEVTYSAQGKDYTVKLNTLANMPNQQANTTRPQF